LPIYETRGIVSKVNGMAELDDVTAAIDRIIA
jgi:adenylate kinase